MRSEELCALLYTLELLAALRIALQLYEEVLDANGFCTSEDVLPVHHTAVANDPTILDVQQFDAIRVLSDPLARILITNHTPVNIQLEAYQLRIGVVHVELLIHRARCVATHHAVDHLVGRLHLREALLHHLDDLLPFLLDLLGSSQLGELVVVVVITELDACLFTDLTSQVEAVASLLYLVDRCALRHTGIYDIGTTQGYVILYSLLPSLGKLSFGSLVLRGCTDVSGEDVQTQLVAQFLIVSRSVALVAVAITSVDATVVVASQLQVSVTK